MTPHYARRRRARKVRFGRFEVCVRKVGASCWSPRVCLRTRWARRRRQRPLVRDRLVDRLDRRRRTERDNLFRQLEITLAIRDRESVDRRLASLYTLIVADRPRVRNEHVERDLRVIVKAVAFPNRNPTRFHVLRDSRVVVVLLDVRDDRITLPDCRERISDGTLTALIPTAVADQDDVLEAVRLEAVYDVGQQRAEGFLTQADRATGRHVPTRRIDAPLGYECNHRRAERVAERARDGLAIGAQHVVVFPERE